MEVVHAKLSFQDVYSLLMNGNDDFSPSLTRVLDVDSYALKLSRFAEFLILGEAGDKYGCIAYYANEAGKFIYISHYWVSSKLQGQGYGKLLLNRLIDAFKNNYKEIRLEVVKSNSAIFFYQKQGFSVIEDRGHKALLCLPLN